ncbi:WD40-repeat-containing domain protein [Gilbertella persicaria]|uniref:WD40-repeat-containing domain protein n=1 Tax=Gilbertella persicaria TaxID=101096 RepID=UPI00222067A4|nr:WD40-repeat-containing domain protein [Gilbertella persicaria]KAI8060375.1 WD40-repeat-containing domain protein [Gilbertella persicaria]
MRTFTASLLLFFMSLFDKISGLANKAKENVVSKTFLSKDKRLEQPLSRDIDLNDIYFEKISNYGLPSTVQVVAFDCVAGLLAVAGGQSKIKVFGKGISALIHVPKSEGIKYMQFKTGYPILSVIDKANTIITVDLRTQSIRHAFKAPDIITCQAYYPGTDWLFIGYANGFIDVFDMMQGTLSPYQIPDLAQNGKLVLDLQLHPTELNTLLIGYENKMFIWNIREQTIRRSFSLPQSTSLTCLVWSPHAARFMAGYDDGFIHLWDTKHEQKPIASRRLSENSVQSSEDPEPIYQMAWYTNSTAQRSYLVVAGGLNPTDIRGLNILEYDLEGEQREPRKQTILPTGVSHFMMLNKDIFYSGMADPLGIAIVDNDHSLQVFSLEHGFPSLQLPPALNFLSPFVLSVCYISQLPDQVYKKLTTITQEDYRVRHMPITGGIAGPDHVYQINSNDILVTVHEGEILKFWDASFTALRPLYSRTIRCSDYTPALLCCLDLNKETGILAVGYSDGSIILYECCQETTVPKSKAFIDSCDDTLQEISDLLQDMEVEETSPPVQENTEEPNEQDTEMKSKFTSLINDNSSNTMGYSANMMVTLGKAAVTNIMILLLLQKMEKCTLWIFNHSPSCFHTILPNLTIRIISHFR